MNVVEVKSKQQKKQFLNLVNQIYKDDQNYVRPLDILIEEIFDSEKNDLFQNGKATRYILFSDNVPIGRIAVFINEKKAKANDLPTGGVGFFECIDNQEAANVLFDVAKKWLIENGIEAMDGPINFGENDNFWGLLVEGFTQPGFGMQYNPPYYQKLFETYGFAVYYEQITKHLNLEKPFPERFWKIAERVMKKPGLSFKHFNWSECGKFANDFVEVYNEAWQFHEGFVPMKVEHLLQILKKSKAFVMEELIWFAYMDDKPIGFIAMFLDANQILKKFHGKMSLINKLKFLIYKNRKIITRIRVTVLGVKPAFQRMGIESSLFYQYRDVVARNKNINEMELSWVGDFNPKMRKLEDAMGADFGKKHITYRYLFDRNKEVEARSKVIPMNTKDSIQKDEK